MNINELELENSLMEINNNRSDEKLEELCNMECEKAGIDIIPETISDLREDIMLLTDSNDDYDWDENILQFRNIIEERLMSLMIK